VAKVTRRETAREHLATYLLGTLDFVAEASGDRDGIPSIRAAATYRAPQRRSAANKRGESKRQKEL
jgi:hypothetical protein